MMVVRRVVVSVVMVAMDQKKTKLGRGGFIIHCNLSDEWEETMITLLLLMMMMTKKKTLQEF